MVVNSHIGYSNFAQDLSFVEQPNRIHSGLKRNSHGVALVEAVLRRLSESATVTLRVPACGKLLGAIWVPCSAEDQRPRLSLFPENRIGRGVLPYFMSLPCLQYPIAPLER
jgi:hypothetical protein